jgi:hypothetical protein
MDPINIDGDNINLGSYGRFIVRTSQSGGVLILNIAFQLVLAEIDNTG